MTDYSRATDEDLLTCADAETFGAFYARHVRQVESYFLRRLGEREAAADLAAETFAAALVARTRFVPGGTPAAGWLYAIAARRLVDLRRRRTAERGLREALGGELLVVAGAPAPEQEDRSRPSLLRHLRGDQRDAITAHVIEERDYARIAGELCSSEAAVRQRVSRGLRTLRQPLTLYRAAQRVSRQDRAYRFGGGHGKDLDAIDAREPLDCSAAASLILWLGGALERGRPRTSTQLADTWGQAGEGSYITLWAAEGHVWLEFRLDADHRERFDPTPLRLAPHSGWLSRRRGPASDFVPRHLPGL